MPTIRIKAVSAEAHAILRQRADAAHQSLQEYLKAQLEAEAATPTLEKMLSRAGARSEGGLTLAEAVETVRLDRDRW